MRSFWIGLLLLAASALAAPAEENKPVWRGKIPSGKAHVEDSLGGRDILCYPTILKYFDGAVERLYYRGYECSGEAAGLSDIGMPLDGPPINMKGIAEAHKARIAPNGNIILE